MVSPIKFLFRSAHLVGAALMVAANVATILMADPTNTGAARTLNITVAPLTVLHTLLLPITSAVAANPAAIPLLGAPLVITNFRTVVEITGGVMMIAGIINAVLLKPSKNMASVPADLKKWRRIVYVHKMILFMLATPVANYLLAYGTQERQPSTKLDIYHADIVRSAAAVKLTALLVAAFLGTYARYFREEATVASAAIEEKKKK